MNAREHEHALVLLARLCVDIEWRAAFALDPPRAMQALGVADNACAPLCALVGPTLETLGSMADQHRLARIAEHLSWVDLSLRPDLDRIVVGYFCASLPRLTNREEALAFCKYAENLSEPVPVYLGDLARFERRRIEVAWGISGSGTRARESFGYPVLDVLDRLSKEGWPAARPDVSTVEFKKVPGIPGVLVRRATARAEDPAVS